MFAYCLNNPVNMVDPSGEVAVTTLILIGSIIAGVAASSYTAYTSHKYTGKVDWNNTILSGLSTFVFCYTYGMSAYGMYVSYCNYKGYTPVTNVGTSSATTYPPNNGFNATPRESVLLPGSQLQRVGGTSGRFVAPINTSFSSLSLPPDKIDAPIINLKVLSPISVQTGTAMPWFGQPGGGTQFLLPDTIQHMIETGLIKIMP